MKNFATAGEAIRDSGNPFMAFLDSETASLGEAVELSAFHDRVNGLTLVTNQATAFSPQSGEAMVVIPDTATRMDEATRKELASTCTLMGCAKCQRRALVENELSFTLAGEEMACPSCGEDTTFNYVDDTAPVESAGFSTLAEIQALTFTGNEDSDAASYEGIEQFIMGDASMEDKIAALTVMLKSMGVDETPTAEDVESFMAEANDFDSDSDFEDDDSDFEMATYSQRWIADRYELADSMVGLDSEEDSMDPNAEDTTAVDDAAAPVVDPNPADATGAQVAADADTTTVPPVDDTVPVTDTVETLTDADTPTHESTDGADALAGGATNGDTNDGTTTEGEATVELDDTLETLDGPTGFDAEVFGDDAETTVTVASMVDLSRPLSFARLSADEIAVFVGSNHIGSLRRAASAETAAALYPSGKIEQAFAAAFNANRNAVETASELRGYGFRPVQFRINLGEVAAARVTAARESSATEVATKVAKTVNRNGKLLNLALLGMCKNHFKHRTGLITELASVLERAGVRGADNLVRRAFATKGPEFFAAAVRQAGELANKSDEFLNGISETISDKEFVGNDEPTEAAPAVAVAPVSVAPATGETASFAARGGMDNSSAGKKDYRQLVRSISRTH